MDPDLWLAVGCLRGLQDTHVQGDGLSGYSAAQDRNLAPPYFIQLNKNYQHTDFNKVS